jgi:hypothetical protein
MTRRNKNRAVHAERDLKTYVRKTIRVASILIGGLGIATAVTYFLNAVDYVAPLMGALLGVICATVNVFAIGYAFYVIAIKHGHKRVIGFPLASFIAMCGVAFICAKFWPGLLFGFAVGLTVPLLFGVFVI